MPTSPEEPTNEALLSEPPVTGHEATVAADQVTGHEATVAADQVTGHETTVAATQAVKAGHPAAGEQEQGGPLIEDRYKVEKELGRGGMGRVLLVHDMRIRRNVALKDLLGGDVTAGRGGTSRPSPVVSRFMREVRLSGHLEHPSIVPIYDQGEIDGHPFYTMRYIQGRSFAEALAGCGSLKERLALLPHFRDVCNAMAYAHSRSIIHRDLKPANIILGEYGETMVVDWGLARMREDSEEADQRLAEEIRHLAHEADDLQTVFGVAMGTP
ncbi:serine/threonine protein kinase, partial [Myxococcota bacterium]|nr:serine/threonine protein kinase [Myxococcota bacterium]MBU1535750.1 serine/threonine protein kinase [Myxococcota bacterium]